MSGSRTRPRVQRALIALAGATRFAGSILMGTVMAIYVGRVGSNFAVSMVLAAYFFGMTVFSPVWGAVADVTGRRRAVMVVTGGFATLAVLPLAAVGVAGPDIHLPFGTVDGAWVPIGLRGLYAVFAVGFVPVMLTVVSARGGDEGRGRSLGFFNSARAVGFSGAQVGSGILLGLLAPSSLYLLIAGFSLVSTLAAVLLVDPTPSPETDPGAGEVVAAVRERLFPTEAGREHLRTNGLRWLYVGLALRNMTVLGTMSLMPVFLTRSVGVSEVVMGFLLAINPAGQTVCMYLFGRTADAVGRKPLVVAGMAGSGLFALVASLAVAPGSLALRAGVAGLAFVVIAAAFSAMTTGALAFIGDVAPPDRESELMGLRSTAKGVGGVVGPPLFGAVATVLDIQTAFAAGSLLAFAAAAVTALGITESRPADLRAGEAATAADD